MLWSGSHLFFGMLFLEQNLTWAAVKRTAYRVTAYSLAGICSMMLAQLNGTASSVGTVVSLVMGG